jgi:hypothetical protein
MQDGIYEDLINMAYEFLELTAAEDVSQVAI